MDATPDDVVTLTRLWLSDQLPRNSESKVLGISLRSLKRDTSLKFVLAYSDPAVGHLGIIYQATNWLYTGLSTATPLYDIGDGILHHSRSSRSSVGQSFHTLLNAARDQCQGDSPIGQAPVHLFSG